MLEGVDWARAVAGACVTGTPLVVEVGTALPVLLVPAPEETPLSLEVVHAESKSPIPTTAAAAPTARQRIPSSSGHLPVYAADGPS